MPNNTTSTPGLPPPPASPFTATDDSSGAVLPEDSIEETVARSNRTQREEFAPNHGEGSKPTTRGNPRVPVQHDILDQLGDVAAVFPEQIKQITALHSEIMGMGKMTLEKAIRIGDLLSALKATTPHGQWLRFIKEHLPFDERTGRNYMRLFAEREELRRKSENVSDLLLSQAYALTKRSRGKDPERTSSPKAPVIDELRLSNVTPTTPSRQAELIACATEDVCRGTTLKSAVLEELDPGVLCETRPVGDVIVELASATCCDRSRHRLAAELPDLRSEINREILFVLRNGQEITSDQWQQGFILPDRLTATLKSIAVGWNLPTTVATGVQQVLVACAGVMNRYAGLSPSRETLLELENALQSLRNIIVTHPRYWPTKVGEESNV